MILQGIILQQVGHNTIDISCAGCRMRERRRNLHNAILIFSSLDESEMKVMPSACAYSH